MSIEVSSSSPEVWLGARVAEQPVFAAAHPRADRSTGPIEVVAAADAAPPKADTD